MQSGQEKKYGKGYSREQFYKDCIVVKDSPVVECRISRKKPFAEELKQMIDLRYNLNFAQALRHPSSLSQEKWQKIRYLRM